ncbi:MAG: glycosyltransferase family 2 protein [Deltaproteobacteria bacterium]|nr:glycosyltransferase family 2 protein [Deltaproteobacteria bacterium]
MSRFLSVVIPVYNEEENVPELGRQVTDALKSLDVRYEILFVDDGSNDGTWKAICDASSRHDGIEGIRLSRNFGHQHALLAGLSHARGEAVISMDGDLQHPPRIIPALFEKWEEGFDIVNTVRTDDAETGGFKKMTSTCFYRLFSSMTDVKLAPGSSDFRLIDARVLEVLFGFRDTDIFLRGAVQWVGFNCATVPYTADRRFTGETKYPLKKMLKFALGAVISFSNKPLRMGIWLGAATSVMAAGELVYILIRYAQGATLPGWASTMGIISFLFGVLFIILGIIGLYISRIHKILQGRPRFIVAERTKAVSRRFP